MQRASRQIPSAYDLRSPHAVVSPYHIHPMIAIHSYPAKRIGSAHGRKTPRHGLLPRRPTMWHMREATCVSHASQILPRYTGVRLGMTYRILTAAFTALLVLVRRSPVADRQQRRCGIREENTS